MADIEDTLKKLDRLTQEEARMALAEVLRISHNIRNEVKVVDGKVESVESKVQVVIDGAQGLSSKLKTILTSILSDRKQARVAATEAKSIIRQTAHDIDDIKCS
jgi:hypothetical protein